MTTQTIDIEYPSFKHDGGHKDDDIGITPEEWALRVELAALYRLTALFGWDDLTHTHISVRIPGPKDHFLLNPAGLAFDEVCASNLVKIDLEGNIIGASQYKVSAAGFVIHGGIHMAREDANCIMHLHTEAGMALSMQREGLLPLNQHAMRFYNHIGYHDFEGVALSTDERQRMIAALGSHNVLILRNHGTITVGPSVAEAFAEMFFLEKSARAQLLAFSGGRELNWPTPEVMQKTFEQWQHFRRSAALTDWAAMLRKLDRIDDSYKN